jgi:hypothetical protein
MLELGERARSTARPAHLRAAWTSWWGIRPLAEIEGARGRPGAGGAHYFGDARGRGVASLVTPGDAVLVKASRGLRLEQVVDALLARFGEAAS